jgi:hypothetical protein
VILGLAWLSGSDFEVVVRTGRAPSAPRLKPNS